MMGSVPRIRSGAGLAHSFALGGVGRSLRSLSPSVSLPLCFAFRQPLARLPLPSANVWVTVIRIVTGFTHRGLAPHEFTPMPGVHNRLRGIRARKRTSPVGQSVNR